MSTKVQDQHEDHQQTHWQANNQVQIDYYRRNTGTPAVTLRIGNLESEGDMG